MTDTHTPSESPAPASGAEMSKAARDVLAERRRQVSKEGWSPEHDDRHTVDQMACAAACYAVPRYIPDPPTWWTPKNWPDDWEWKPKSRREDLVRAGALIIAEIERLDRIPKPTTPTVAAESVEVRT